MAAIAPMDLVIRDDSVAIPLQCTICPKKPTFSDLSHLLTHISSKSHLAHRFKAELKARDDREALEEVKQYDSWCERYGINALLAERMAAKEQKKTGRRGRLSSMANNKPEATMSHQDLVKPDPDEYSETLQDAAHWSTIPGHFQDGHHEFFDSSSYPTPNLKRTRSDRSVPTTPENGTRPEYYQRWPSETTGSAPISDIPSESTELDEGDDASKLKGVRYPGMGLFDSADEIQKRMRNQRKDDSVLKQMEVISSGIEPNEFVWAEGGEFQRIRDIYASPSIEGSPNRRLVDTRKPRRGRRSAAATTAGPVRTRASTRITRQTASRGRRAQQNNNDGVSGYANAYDIFHDPPKTSPARTGSPRKKLDHELYRRPALQPTNSNLRLASAMRKPAKPSPYIAVGDVGNSTFTSQPPVSSNHYFQHQHTIGTGTLNPLCVQARGGYYNPYGYSDFGNEAKPVPTNFQAINAMNLGNMSFTTFSEPFASDSTHEHLDQDFDL